MKRKSVETIDGSGEGLPKRKVLKKKENTPAVSHSLKNDKSLYRPPTNEELNVLKETEQLFKSSLFRMQISELLEEVQPKKKKNKALEETLHSLNTLLLSLPDGKEHELSDTTWLSKKVKFPLPSPPSALKGKFQFLKPTNVNVVGSYLLGTQIKPSFNVDVAVQMPKECFQNKDYLNLRYLYKRASYLCVIAGRLIKSKMFDDIKFTHCNGDILRPILLLKPKGKSAKKFTIKLYPVLPEETFKMSRFAPSKNNIRHHWFKGVEASEEGDTGPATSHYNSLVLTDLLMEKHLHCLYQCVTDSPAAREAIMLLSVWLRQRELLQGQGAFSRFLVSMVILHLLSTRKINAHMSSYQILRVFLQFIASSDWTTSGPSMNKDQETDDKLPSLSEFHAAFDVVFVDPSGFLNLCANVDKTMYLRVRHEAKLSMELLDDRFVDGFETLFMKAVPFMQKFDQCFCLPLIECLKGVVAKPELESSLLSRAGDWTPVALSWLTELLKKALGKRLEMLYIRPSTAAEWPAKESPPSLPRDSLTVGLMLNPDHSDSIVEQGPPADSPLAGQFREFWGGKSELRRFQDGSILEAVVWQSSNLAERRTVCERIIKYGLKRHGNVDPNLVWYISNQLDTLLQKHDETNSPVKTVSPGSQASGGSPGMTVRGTGEEQMSQAIQTYDALCKQIRGLDLPLAVHSLQGISPIFRGAEVHPPSPCYRNAPKSKHADDEKENGNGKNNMAANVTLPRETKATSWCPVMEILLQFETSGRWPDDVEAIQHVRSAFHIRLAELINTKLSLTAAASPKCVDVIKDGFAFRIKIVHYREMILLQDSKMADGDDVINHQAIVTNMEREIVRLPTLTSTLHGVQQQFSAYSGCVRLAMRWVSSHLLSSHIPHECVELLVASLFLAPAPFTPPRSSLSGFLRFLHLLSTCDWNTTPIIVNLNNDLQAEDYQEISSKFTNSRGQLPPLFISTPRDKLDSKWTREAPSKLILHRLQVLAKESYHVLEGQLISCDSTDTDYKQIFRPPLDDYDVIIRLNPRMLPRHNEAIDAVKPASSKSSKGQREIGLPVVDFDPVECYVNELKECFSEVALFFYDPLGGDSIAVAWKPESLLPSQFKVLHANYKHPVQMPASKSGKSKSTHAQMVAPNIAAILNDFESLGVGLVKSVEIVKEIAT